MRKRQSLAQVAPINSQNTNCVSTASYSEPRQARVLLTAHVLIIYVFMSLYKILLLSVIISYYYDIIISGGEGGALGQTFILQTSTLR